MKTNQRKKICWYCEGNVPSEAVQCTFCGSDLTPDDKSVSNSYDVPTTEEPPIDQSLASLYKPPYLVRERFNDLDYQETSNRQEQQPTKDVSARSYSAEESLKENEKSGNKDALSLLFLALGSFLMTLGLLLFFFSEEGELILKWDANYWFLYCFFALPLLYFGFRFLGSLTQQNGKIK